VVEATAASSILTYLAFLYLSGRWTQQVSTPGVVYSVLTGLCVGVGTVFFFLAFQKGGPLSAVPTILAGGAAISVIAGIFFFREPISLPPRRGHRLVHYRPVPLAEIDLFFTSDAPLPENALDWLDWQATEHECRTVCAIGFFHP
jgi:uncharacterized membrane protein